MSSSLIEKLKFNLQEKKYPLFEDEELKMLLENNDNDLNKASYAGCLMKADANDGIEIAGIKIASNRDYWLSLAKQFKKGAKPCYKTSMKRVDEV